MVGTTHAFALPPGAIPGQTPGTAIRVRTGTNGQVCLEQLGHSRSSGWHIQKTFSIPCELLPAVLRELRKADCLTPQSQRRNLTPNTCLCLRLAD